MAPDLLQSSRVIGSFWTPPQANIRPGACGRAQSSSAAKQRTPDFPGSAHRSSSRPHRAYVHHHGQAHEATFQTNMLDNKLLESMVHPYFCELPEPKRLSHGARGEICIYPPGFDTAQRITNFAKDIAEKLKASEPIVLSCACNTPADFVPAVVSMGMFHAGLSRSRPSFSICTGDDDLYQAICKSWRKWQRSTGICLAPLDQTGQGFNWIRMDTSPEAHLKRQVAAASSLREGSRLSSIRTLVSGTQLITGEADKQQQPQRSCRPIELAHHQGTALEAALEERSPHQVAVVNAASAFQVGGGFLSGGRHALEEAMCMQSTLFFSLQEAARRAQKSGSTMHGRSTHIPDDSAILSPGVEVFRAGTAKGYAAITPVQLAAVLSIAMPNKNPRVNDNPCDDRSGNEYESLISKKFRAVLQGAAEARAKVLVMPDVGCGVFENDPRVVGKVFAEALRGFEGSLEKVVLVGCDDFCKAVQAAYSGKQASELRGGQGAGRDYPPAGWSDLRMRTSEHERFLMSRR